MFAKSLLHSIINLEITVIINISIIYVYDPNCIKFLLPCKKLLQTWWLKTNTNILTDNSLYQKFRHAWLGSVIMASKGGDPVISKVVCLSRIQSPFFKLPSLLVECSPLLPGLRVLFTCWLENRAHSQQWEANKTPYHLAFSTDPLIYWIPLNSWEDFLILNPHFIWPGPPRGYPWILIQLFKLGWILGTWIQVYKSRYCVSQLYQERLFPPVI